MGLANSAGLSPQVAYPARILASALVLAVCSRRLIAWRPSRPWTSVLIGGAVFAVWIAPDVVFPAYRQFWLFSNPVTGMAQSSLPVGARTGALFILFRLAGSSLVVPILEELFWRAWLMRWLIAPDFATVRLGTYAARAFWITAVLFAAEHGPYWDVGLAAGVAYNWWMIRHRSLADCILAHAVTNLCLGAWVLAAGAWQYWL
jgi:hypothetical protein